MMAAGMGEAFETHLSGSPDEVEQKTPSFLNPVGETAKQVPPNRIGAKMEMFVFITFVFIRALHPLVIGESKTEVDLDTGKKTFPYQTSSTVIAMTLGLCIFFVLTCLAKGGVEQFMSIFEPEPMKIFSVSGAVYALNNYLEMASLGALPPAAYQIIQQFRIVITAHLLIPAKNQYQTRLQWTILLILMFGMSTYMCISSSKTAAGADSSGGDALEVIVGLMFAMGKVFISCICAVITDKYMKKYKKDPTHVCLARTFFARAVVIVLLSFTQDVWQKGFFHGWDTMTVVVTGSFCVKSTSTIYIVALLDSILKNIAESYSILVIYAFDVLSPWGAKSFDAATCMAVLVVVATCTAYLDSKSTVEKATKYDDMQRG
jgi:UDP-sugar transporter A1/2/3